jgi:hypothetical protein
MKFPLNLTFGVGSSVIIVTHYLDLIPGQGEPPLHPSGSGLHLFQCRHHNVLWLELTKGVSNILDAPLGCSLRNSSTETCVQRWTKLFVA